MVEGDSAGGSAKQGRNRKDQAILPLRGKILNVEKARLEKMLASQEIAILITALGCGVADDKDTNKARYHRIIIMTDADVDGSHIRTLLLTFFYRQYPELLEKGYVYIAQPPLYKVKKGKKELYLKNEHAMEEYLIDTATEELRLTPPGDGQSLEGEALKALVKKALRYKQVLRQIEKKADVRVVDAIINASDLSKTTLKDAAATAKALAHMQAYLDHHYPDLSDAKFKLEPDPEHGGYRIVLPQRAGGARRTTIIDFTFLDSPEYVELATLAQEFLRLGTPPYDLAKDGEHLAVERLDQLVDSTLEIGRRGLQIQRYKGLGEMNPEQLWETTMDPARRTLLQVRADDQGEAEKIFSVLMGDLVEPRRDFIEQNALNVRNLDV
ncbi:MAG TPA: toprim domain-containing protein [Polyangia bacterium]